MMDEAFSGWNGEAVGSAWTPTCDVREDKEHLTITLDLPGVKPEDVKISLENQVLTIRGERRQVSEQTDERWHRYERSYGSFERSFTLPTTVDAERIQATTEHGVLNITLPKVERAKPREIPVKSSVGVGTKPETVSTVTECKR
jgi:HSP20 family protein